MIPAPPTSWCSTASLGTTQATGGCSRSRMRRRSSRAATLPSTSPSPRVPSTARAYPSVWSRPSTSCACYDDTYAAFASISACGRNQLGN
ncbi:hypothetical protein SGLAM104S_06192 [Streptomyces glaucescens]